MKERIEELLRPVMAKWNAFLVDIHFRHEHGRKVIQVLVDTDEGITIDECAEISREFARELDTKGLIQESYELEVSSPGIDKPLRLLRQYQKNLGRVFNVKYNQGEQQVTLKGTLIAVDGNRLTFAGEKGEAVTLLFENIIESKEELPW